MNDLKEGISNGLNDIKAQPVKEGTWTKGGKSGGADSFDGFFGPRTRKHRSIGGAQDGEANKRERFFRGVMGADFLADRNLQ